MKMASGMCGIPVHIRFILRQIKITFFHSAEELLATLHDTLQSIKDIPHILKKFNSPSSFSTSSDWKAFVKSICSLLHINKIFEVGISENLREELKYLNQSQTGRSHNFREKSVYHTIQEGGLKRSAITQSHLRMYT